MSIVVPLFNEAACVEKLYQRLCEMGTRSGIDLEFIFVNDHSTDETLTILKKLRSQDPRIKIISFSRNFGHQLAVTAGLKYASGTCVAVMDADLQDPPELLGQMVEKWRQGYDVVYGIRQNRKDGLIKKFACHLFYRLLQRMSEFPIPLDAGDFCLMSRRVLEKMKGFQESQPYVRGLRAWAGFRQIGIPYDRGRRAAGRSKYNFWRLSLLAFDGFCSFSVLPMRIAGAIGILVALVSFIGGTYVIITYLLARMGIITSLRIVPGWATLMCSMMFFMGLQFVFLGILGEYIGRIFMQTKGRPFYIIEEEIGF